MPQSVRTFLSSSPSATRRIAALLAQNAKPGDVYALRGGLGAGKTLFAQAFARALGVRGSLRSPTFVLVSQHGANKRGVRRLFHVDLYRLRRLGSQDRYAIEEVVGDRAGVVLIEWPERAWGLLPKDAVVVDFTMRGERARLVGVRRIRR